MVPLPLSRLQPSRTDEIEDWPYRDEAVLLKSRSRRVCMTCQWFRHHAGVNCIPMLTCQLHQGLIAHGEHLTSRCQGWTDDQVRQKGWAPEVAQFSVLSGPCPSVTRSDRRSRPGKAG